MLGNFTYCNPTKLCFGKNALSNSKEEFKKYGDNIVLIYGGYKPLNREEIIRIFRESV